MANGRPVFEKKAEAARSVDSDQLHQRPVAGFGYLVFLLVDMVLDINIWGLISWLELVTSTDGY